MPPRRLFTLVAAALVATAASAAPSPATRVGDAVQTLTRDSRWTQVSATPLEFDAYHPQGMVKVGEAFFVSSVEIQERTRFYPQRRDGFDRDQGKGQGWLFKIGPKGELLASLKLGDGPIYHAGGLDFDGRYLWVPTAEYRPGGPSIIYRVDPAAMTATEAFRVNDHIGAVAWDPATRSLTGLSWGGRNFYRWVPGADLKLRGDARAVANRSHYVDYQDCHSAGPLQMLCSGLANYYPRPASPPIALGGVELIDLRDLRPLWQAPVQAWTAAGMVMTANAAFFEASPDGVRGWFLPEDGRGSLYVYDAKAPAR